MPSGGERPHVLLIDDEPCILSSVARVLEYSGYRVSTASSGEQAVALAARETFHAVMCDLRMPGLSGVALCERLWEANPELRGRLVVVSGDLGSPDIPELIARAGIPSLAKPFGKADLLRVLRATA
ncbi:MAG TPA: response regulator [Gemmatimonadales bacterium]|nr:response regulator [Gemmatimonadales bacterium]